MSIIFHRGHNEIHIEAPQTEVTIQELYNTIRDWEAEPAHMSCCEYGSILTASGKDYLGAGLYTGITLVLLYGWKVMFEERPGPEVVSCSITGGNILAINMEGDYVNPIAPAAYTQVVISVAVSATIREIEVPAPPIVTGSLTLPQLIAWDLSRE